MASFSASSAKSSASSSYTPNTDSSTLTKLKAAADYIVEKSFEAETQDFEDHTFCGIMFDLQTKQVLPLEFIEISSIWVRGGLGPLTVYWTKDTHVDKSATSKEWTQVYAAVHKPSPHALVELILTTPIHLQPGDAIGLYVHSTMPGDQAIVYDNQRGDVTLDDPYMRITPGMAHIANTAFSKNGMWGWAWRPNREFVGKIGYGVRYKLWNPNLKVASSFPKCFRSTAVVLLMCHNRRESPLYRLPHAVILFMLNMMPWDWNGELLAEEQELVDVEQIKLASESNHQGRSYYQRIHQQNHYNDDEDDDDDDEEEEEEDEEWVEGGETKEYQENSSDDEYDQDGDYVDFHGIAIPRALAQSNLFQERPEQAFLYIQQILQEQMEAEEAAHVTAAEAEETAAHVAAPSPPGDAHSSASTAGIEIMEEEDVEDVE